MRPRLLVLIALTLLVFSVTLMLLSAASDAARHNGTRVFIVEQGGN